MIWKKESVYIYKTRSNDTNMYPGRVEDFIEEKNNSRMNIERGMDFWYVWFMDSLRYDLEKSEQNAYTRYVNQMRETYPEVMI